MYLYRLAYKYCSGLLNADTATSLACVAGAKRGGGRGGQKGKRESIPLPFFPSSLSAIRYPFRRLLRRLPPPLNIAHTLRPVKKCA